MTDLLGVMEAWAPPTTSVRGRGRHADRDRAGRHRVRQAGAAPALDADADQRRAGLPALERVLARRAHRAGRRLAAAGVRRVQCPRQLGDGGGRPGRAVRRGRRPGARVLRRARPAGVGPGDGRLRDGRPLRGRRLGDRPAGRGRLALPARVRGAGLARRTAVAARDPPAGLGTTATPAWLANDSRALAHPDDAVPCSRDRRRSASCRCWTTRWSWRRAGWPADGDWAGITDVWVSPDHRRAGPRRDGRAARVVRGTGRRDGVPAGPRGQRPGLALYAALGFRTHHIYRYLAPGAPDVRARLLLVPCLATGRRAARRAAGVAARRAPLRGHHLPQELREHVPLDADLGGVPGRRGQRTSVQQLELAGRRGLLPHSTDPCAQEQRLAARRHLPAAARPRLPRQRDQGPGDLPRPEGAAPTARCAPTCSSTPSRAPARGSARTGPATRCAGGSTRASTTTGPSAASSSPPATCTSCTTPGGATSRSAPRRRSP